MEHASLLSSIESALFVSGEPVSFARLTQSLGVPEKEVREAVALLAQEYKVREQSGLMIIEHEKSVLLATKPKNASVVETLTKTTLQEAMSKASLEVLAIIAYRAPISRAEIDAIRGVNSSFTLRNLLLRDLIAREGNPSDHRGYLYRPTFKFLQTLGLTNENGLPDYETLTRDERLTLVLEKELEDSEKDSNIK